jgi:hypothetical protein
MSHNAALVRFEQDFKAVAMTNLVDLEALAKISIEQLIHEDMANLGIHEVPVPAV